MRPSTFTITVIIDIHLSWYLTIHQNTSDPQGTKEQPMEFKCFNEWDQLPQNSDALFTQAEKSSLFFSQRWFKNLVTTALIYDEKMQLACVIEKANVTDSHGENKKEEDTVLAILPLISRDNKEWSSLHHIYTSLYTLLMEDTDSNRQEIFQCLAEGLSLLPFYSLTLRPIAEDDHRINNLLHALETSGLACNRYFRFFNWFYPLQGQTFADYMAARSSRVRNTIARKQRKLEREHGYEIRLHTGSDVQQAIADYHTVYKASWKPNEPHKHVIEGLTDTVSKQSWTRLAILYIKGQPVAAQLWFVVHKKANILKLAYDETWKQYSPGSILTQYLMEYVIDTDKVEEIDYLTGNDHYKQEWMSARRRRYKLVFMRKNEPEKRGIKRLIPSFMKS